MIVNLTDFAGKKVTGRKVESDEKGRRWWRSNSPPWRG